MKWVLLLSLRFYRWRNSTIERFRDVPKVTQVWSGGTRIWPRAAWLHKYDLSLPLISWALRANVPTAFKLLLPTTGLAEKHSHSLNPPKHVLLSLYNPASSLVCFLNKCVTQSSLKLYPWESLRQLLPRPLPWSTNSTLTWVSRTCPISGFELPESTKPSLTWLPLWPPSKASHFKMAISFLLWKYRSHLLTLVSLTANRTK